MINEADNNAEEIDSEAPEEVAADDAPEVEASDDSPEGAASVAAASAEDEPEADAPASSDEPAEASFIDIIEGLIGDVPEQPRDEIISALQNGKVDKLPQYLRGYLRHSASKFRAMEAELAEAKKTGESKLAGERQAFESEVQKWDTQRARFARSLREGKYNDLLTEADKIDSEAIDPLTDDGQRALAKLHAAEYHRAFTDEIVKDAVAAEKLAELNQFIVRNPEMKKADFKKEMANLIRSRQAAGGAMTTEDAYAIVRGNRAATAARARLQADRSARARAASKVGRVTGTGRVTVDLESQVSAISKKGYVKNGQRLTGSYAVYSWLQDNPTKAKAYQKLLQAS